MDINKKSRTELKAYYIKNAIPTESNFRDFIDAVLVHKDDGITKSSGSPLCVEAQATGDRPVINLYDSFTSQAPNFVLSLLPGTTTAGTTTGRGFSIGDGTGSAKARLFIEEGTGNVGIGTVAPAGYRLAVAGTMNVLGVLTASAGILVPTGQTVTMNGAVNLNAGATVSGQVLTASAGISVPAGQTIVANGPLYANSTALIAGLLSASGGATITGGSLTVGSTSANQALEVYGKVTAKYAAEVIGTLTATGGITVPSGKDINAQGTITATGAIAANGGITVPSGKDITVTGTITSSGTIAANGGITVPSGKDITVTGTITSAGAIAANGGITVPSGKDVTVSGTITSSGTIAANGGITVPLGKDITVTGTITSSGTIAANGGLSVAANKDLTANGTITAAGAITANGGITVAANKDLTANGTITAAGLVKANLGLQVAGAQFTASYGAAISGGSLTVGTAASNQVMDVYGKLTAKYAAEVVGLLTATGGLTVASGKDISAGGAITASGLITANLGLTVTGAALTVGSATTGQNLDVYGTLNAKSNLGVTGGLTVNGSSKFVDTTTFGNVIYGPPNDYAKLQYSLSGGGVITWAGPGGRLKWTQRFIAIGGEHGITSSQGYIDIGPSSDTLAVVQDWNNAARASSSAGVVLNGWEALYAVHTLGGDQTAVSFRIVYHGYNYKAPSNWILIAVVNGDNGTVKLGTGQLMCKNSTLQKSGEVPSGTIVLWSQNGTSTIPDGWALCDGSNGTPDLRNRFIVGAGSGYGVNATGGADSVTLTEAQMPSHGHNARASGYDDKNFTGGNTTDGGLRIQFTRSDAGGANYNTETTDDAGSDQPHENRPPYYALYYIMKL